MKRILVALFIFCQFSFFVKALNYFDSKYFYELEYNDIFFEIGSLCSLCNKGNYGIIIGMGFESKYKDSYTFYQNCFDLVYYKNNFDLRWTPSVFFGDSTVKIGAGIPLVFFGDSTVKIGAGIPLGISIGIRPSVKLTIKNILYFEVYYQYLMKASISHDAVKSNEFGLILKISTYTEYYHNGRRWSDYY